MSFSLKTIFNTLFNNWIILVFLVSFFTSNFSFTIAQANKTIIEGSLKIDNKSSTNSNQANQDKIEFKNETGNPIITFTDEGGNTGSITLKPVTPFKTANKLYNELGVLKFNGNTIGTGGANSINELSDAIHDGTNIFMGNLSGSNYNGGSNTNTALGYETMKNITTGGGNTAVGNVALKANTNGGQNTAIGNSALVNNSLGNYNVAIGVSSSFSNTIGSGNTSLGHTANQFNQEGSNNTIIGYQAGKGTSGHTKSGNVFLGYQAGISETGDNKLYIENSNSPTPLIWGDFSTDSAVINGNFHVTGNITTDGASLGITKIDDLIDAKHITTSLFLGNGAGSSDNASYNNFNTAVGQFALNQNKSGVGNTAIGYNSLLVSFGSGNSALGNSTLVHNSSGTNNTTVGNSSLVDNTTGDNNVSLGYFSLRQNEIGNDNTAIGSNSLQNSIGSRNVALGYKAGSNEMGDDKLYIENTNSATPLIWGDFANDIAAINGNFGVNTHSPTARVDIVASSSEDPFRVAIGGSTKLKVHSNGGTSIGLNATGTPANGLYVEGDINYNSALASVSDKRYKKNIKNISDPIGKINSINGVYYDWRSEEFPERDFTEKKQIGVIAQEVEAILPELVTTNSEGYKSVDYSKLTAVLIEAVKVQNLEFDKQYSELRERIEDLEQENSDLKTTLLDFISAQKHSKLTKN